MRRLTEPEAHRARVDIMEGRYPDDLKARCAWCGKVATVADGAMVEATVRGTGAVTLFRCGSCAVGGSEGSAA